MQSQVRFNRVPEQVPEKVPEKSGRLWCKAKSGSAGSEEGSWRLWRRACQVQQGSGSGSGEDLGGFGAKPGQVQQGSEEGSGKGSRRLWCKARSSSTGFRRGAGSKVPVGLGAETGQFRRRFGSCGAVPEALVRSQVRFNRVPEQVPEKAPRRSGRLWFKARSG